MAGGGQRPGAGRPKGSPNKHTVGKAMDEAKVRAAIAAREPIPSASLDPVAAMELIYRQFMGQAAAEQGKVDDQGRRIGDPAVWNDHLLNAQRVLRDMAPYLRPRLGSIDHKFPEMDLSRLTDAQLAQLAAIVFAAADNPEGQDPRRTGTTTH